MAGIAHLQQENIKLRQERHTMLDLMVIAQNKIDALTEENAALKQLVLDCLKHMYEEPEDIVNVVGRMSERGTLTTDDYHLMIDVNWREVHLELERRFEELL